jgi:hypothetical protein
MLFPLICKAVSQVYLTLLDLYSDKIRAFQIYGKSATVVTETFQMFCDTVGFPTEVLSDRGGEFVGLKDFVSLHRRTAAYRPQSNSRLERKHREIGNLCRTNDISPLDAVLLLNDDNVERLFGENRPAGDFCLRYVQKKQRTKGDDVWEGLYMVTAQLGDRIFELESEFVARIDDLRVFRYSDLCKCSKDACSRCLALWGLDGIEKDFVGVFWFDFWVLSQTR